jgi:hypothetical protein
MKLKKKALWSQAPYFTDNLEMQRKSVAFFCGSVISLLTVFCALSPIFRRVRKISKSDCYLRHVRPSAWNSVPTGRIFMKADIWLFFRKYVEKIQVYLNQTRRKGTLHEGLFIVMVISRLMLLRMKNMSDKCCRETQNTHFMFNSVFRKLCRLWNNVAK